MTDTVERHIDASPAAAAPEEDAAAALARKMPPLVTAHANYGWREHPQYYAHPNNALSRVTLKASDSADGTRFAFTSPEHSFRLSVITPVVAIQWAKFWPCGNFKGDWPNTKFGAEVEHKARNEATLVLAAWDPAFRTDDGLDPYAAHFLEYVRALGARFFQAVAADPRAKRKALEIFLKDQQQKAKDAHRRPPSLAEAEAEWARLGCDLPLGFKFSVGGEPDPRTFTLKIGGNLFQKLTAKSAAFLSNSKPRALPSQRLADLCKPFVAGPDASADEKARDAPYGRKANVVDLYWMANQQPVPFDERKSTLTQNSLVSVAVELDLSIGEKNGRPRLALDPKGVFLYRQGDSGGRDEAPLARAHAFPGAALPPSAASHKRARSPSPKRHADEPQQQRSPPREEEESGAGADGPTDAELEAATASAEAKSARV